ncbi:Wd domain-containing protein, partial [Globisporangium splendens]
MAAAALADQVLLFGSCQENELYVADASTGGQLYCFKNGRTSRFGVQVLPRTDHLVAMQDNKLAAHIWVWSKDMPVWKCHTAEKMGPTCVTQCGNFLFAGAQSGKVYVWDVKTGELVMVWDAHYKSVSTIALTSDDSHVITAGDDAVVHVWRLMDILDEPDVTSSFQQGLTPVVSWTDHVLPVTSIHVSHGGVDGRIYTSSLDRTCKIWSLNSPQCLFSVTCPSFVNVCVADPMEHRLFMGCGNGKIYALDLNAAASSVTAAAARILSSSRGSGASASSASPWGPDALLPDAFEGHEVSVTTMQVSECGGFLFTGDENGVVRVWDSLSRQSLRTIKLFKGKVSALLLIPKPRNLFHKVKTSRNASQEENGSLAPPLPIAPLKKYMNTSSSDTADK